MFNQEWQIKKLTKNQNYTGNHWKMEIKMLQKPKECWTIEEI